MRPSTLACTVLAALVALPAAPAEGAPKRGAAAHRTVQKKKTKKGKRKVAQRRPARSVAASSRPLRPRLLEPLPRTIRCPEDMVAVAGRVCVDRYETSLVDARTSRAWSPFYPPDRGRAEGIAVFFTELRERGGGTILQARMPLPELAAFAIEPRAVSAAGVVPQGYMTGVQAEAACKAAGKRLCTEPEWVTACRGEARRDFPYGSSYVQGACNVLRESHPSVLLHGSAARFHMDPRNNLVEIEGRPLLLPTGSAERCASRWGDDAVMDMVGNLDEWIDDPGGVFVGGFFSRGTRAGCFARISAHVRTYADYSTGARCCADPRE